jgi:hypothetical protein
MRTLLTIIVAAILALPVTASQVRQLSWEDLVPSAVSFDDPFAEMGREKLEYLGFVVRVRNMIATDQQVSQATREEAAELEAELIKAGIDIDGLLARRDELRELRKKRATAVVTELDGTTVKLPGYVLPLEYSGRMVREFLLVPWVGACIHTPPPPPNQIVHVILDKENAFESSSMYEPVWVAGEMLIRESTRNLFLKDGSGDFNIAYRLNANLVEPYKNRVSSTH